MVRRIDEQTKTSKTDMFGGSGAVQFRHLLNGTDEMNGKGRLCAIATIQPGDSIGPHVHEAESELFYILSGQGEYNDGGEIVSCGPGDVLHDFVGGLHAIRNTGDVPLEFLAVILYE